MGSPRPRARLSEMNIIFQMASRNLNLIDVMKYFNIILQDFVLSKTE